MKYRKELQEIEHEDDTKESVDKIYNQITKKIKTAK